MSILPSPVRRISRAKIQNNIRRSGTRLNLRSEGENMKTVTSTDDPRLTKRLLTCGIAAGPVYIILGLIQMAIRPGFDITRHSLSLLANGDLGWIQILNFLATGILLIAGAIGMKRALKSGRGSRWGSAADPHGYGCCRDSWHPGGGPTSGRRRSRRASR